MTEPIAPHSSVASNDTMAYFKALVFIGQSIMFGCYMIAEAIKLLKHR